MYFCYFSYLNPFYSILNFNPPGHRTRAQPSGSVSLFARGQEVDRDGRREQPKKSSTGFDKSIAKQFEVSFRRRIGTDIQYDKSVTLLNRIPEGTHEGIMCEADEGYADIII